MGGLLSMGEASGAGGSDAKKFTSALIWMHGLGDTESGWSGMIRADLDLSPSVGACKLVFPRAPTQHVTCNSSRTTSWFDMAELPLGAQDLPPLHGCSLEQAQESAKTLHKIIDDLREEGIPSERIVVGGFSQGGATAMLTCLTYPHRLAGCVCYSGILLGADRLESLATPAAKGLPIFWGHGGSDNVLEPSLQQLGVSALKGAGFRVTAKTYEGVPHSSSRQEMKDASEFVNGLLSGGSS
mmetsp:Transcript_144632/g.463432  ORF Transcript_144632/g.463432 Transcript_144632/m.463432 type:complete len:241 (+) Transcript_144632:98-820(+)